MLRRARATCLLAWVCSAAASAEPTLVTPPGPVSPDGFEILVLDAPDPTVDGADLRALGGGVFQLTPRPTSREVRIRAGTLQRTLAVGPPASTVSLALGGATPVKGRDREALLRVRVGGAGDTEAVTPVLRANVGSIVGLERVGPQEFTARYVLPTTRYPEVAVVVAFSAWPHPQSVHGAVGTLRVPLASAVDVPGKTEPGATMKLTIAGKTFGPVTASTDGAFVLPVVVPPGFGQATGVAVDRIGNRRNAKFDLALPPTDQLSCVVTPPKLPADGRSKARVLCATSDPFGAPARGANVRFTAGHGKFSAPRELGEGILEWTWTAPSERGSGVEKLNATWRQGSIDAREELSVELVQGPVDRASLTVNDAVAHRGAVWRATVEAVDVLGRAVPGVRVLADRAAGELTVSAPDGQKTRLTWQVPVEAQLGPMKLPVVVWGPPGTEPARLHVFSAADGPRAAVTDLAGLPVPAQPLSVDGRTITTGEDGTAALGSLPDGIHELRHQAWSGLHSSIYVWNQGHSLFPNSRPSSQVLLEGAVTVAPQTPVVVRLEEVSGQWLWWVEAPSGEILDGRSVMVTLDGASTEVTSKGKTALGAARQTSIVDRLTNVGAVRGVE